MPSLRAASLTAAGLLFWAATIAAGSSMAVAIAARSPNFIGLMMVESPGSFLKGSSLRLAHKRALHSGVKIRVDDARTVATFPWLAGSSEAADAQPCAMDANHL